MIDDPDHVRALYGTLDTEQLRRVRDAFIIDHAAADLLDDSRAPVTRAFCNLRLAVIMQVLVERAQTTAVSP